MILEDSLKDLGIQVKTGGSIVTHRPTFTSDAKNILLVADNKIRVYNTQTFLWTDTLSIPTVDGIANIAPHPKIRDAVVVCTVKGGLFDIEVTSGKVLARSFIPFKPKGWDQFLLSIHNLIYPKCEQFFLTAFVEGHTTYPTLYSVRKTPEIPYFLEKLCVNIVNNFHSVATGVGGDMLVAIQENALFVRDCLSKVTKKHLYGDRVLTCVAAHPTDWLCATGDDTGRIILWSNASISNVPAKTVFHWHTLPVADLLFSVDGSQMMSGGGECTLVKWDIRETENKRTIPRLGLPIRHVAVSSKNSMVAVSQADNTIKIIDVHNKALGTVQSITQCYIPENANDSQASDSALGGSKVYQVGLNVDPNARALVTNGRPGHLQCYSFVENKHLYELDITNQNYITEERHKVIPFIEINHISFSKSGRWLATVESRVDNDVHTEARLKFWKFDHTKQRYVLNTSVEWPHENGVVSLKIQPIDDNDPTLMAATSGGDRKFKTWGVVHDTSIHGKSEWWNCDNVGTHRNHTAGPLCFSSDGSLLAVSFAHILTLWTTDAHELIGAFSHLRLPDPIKFVEFGTRSNGRLVICCSDSALAVWDVITFSLLWAIPFQAESLAVDPLRGIAVAFSTKRHAYFFTPSSPEPLAIHHNVSKSKVTSSVFVPTDHSLLSGMKSTLVFMNLSHELCAFVPKDMLEVEEESGTIKLAQAKNLPRTPFAQLVAKTTTKVAPKQTNRQISPGLVGLVGAQIIKEVIESSPHTMPSISFFCQKLLNETTSKITPDERFKEVEELVLASHKKRKPLYFPTSSFATQNEEKMEVDDERPNVGIGGVPLQIPSDLKSIAQEDISWISKIVFP